MFNDSNRRFSDHLDYLVFCLLLLFFGYFPLCMIIKNNFKTLYLGKFQTFKGRITSIINQHPVSTNDHYMASLVSSRLSPTP